jgi:hypothetical protein
MTNNHSPGGPKNARILKWFLTGPDQEGDGDVGELRGKATTLAQE